MKGNVGAENPIEKILCVWLDKARGNIYTLASARKLILISGKIRHALFAK